MYSNIRLFNGDDILDMLRTGKFGTWYDVVPESLPDIETFENVVAENFLILKMEDGTGRLSFNVRADVKYKEKK